MKITTSQLGRRWRRAVAAGQHQLAEHLAFRITCNAINGA